MDDVLARLSTLTFARPEALYLLAGVALVLIWSLFWIRRFADIGAPLLRAIVLALFVLALAGPETVSRNTGVTRPVVVDLSASITAPMRAWTRSLLVDRLKLSPEDPAIVFGAAPRVERVGDVVKLLGEQSGCLQCDPGHTNIEAALDKLSAEVRDTGGPDVLVTDGWENQGQAANAVSALLAARIDLAIFTPPGAQDLPNVAVASLQMPPVLPRSRAFALGVTMLNLNRVPVRGVLTLYQGNKQLEQRDVELPAGEKRLDFNVEPAATGLVSYQAVFKPQNPAQDIYPEDDSAQGWVGIGARRRILIVTEKARSAADLETVARKAGFEPQTVTVGAGQFNASLSGYDAVILDNVPRSSLAPAAQQAMVHYVESGGSLAMVGGDRSFGLGGYQGSPIARVMPVEMKPPQHKESNLALVLIIDKSGSMGRNNKLVYAKAAARTVTQTLKNNDYLAVIGFDSQPFVLVPLEPLSKSRPYFDQLVDRLRAAGTTYLMPALEEAYRMLAASGVALKHVVILTDGETGGTAAMYYDMVSKMHREGGVTVSTVAIGDRANVPLLQAISRYGGGGFYQTDSPQTLPRIVLADVRSHGAELTMVEKNFVPIAVRPNPILKELANRQLPALKGYVSTGLRPGADLSLYVNRSGVREPVVAGWKYSAGRALAVTTDASGRWSKLWVENGILAPLWSRLLAWMTPNAAAPQEDYGVAMGYRDGRVVVRITDYSAQTATSARMMSALVTEPDGRKTQAFFSEDVPGEIEGSFEAHRPGTYFINLEPPAGSNRKIPPLAYTVSPAVWAEVPRPAPNYGLLEELASATGGHLNPPPESLHLSRPTVEHRTSLNPYALVAAMLLLIAEALVRRLTA